VPPPADGSAQAIQEFTQRCSDVIEARVRQHPDLWLWMHRRWREVPDRRPGLREPGEDRIDG
jgi:lauroyl/myristoyl acyltransferase